MHPGGRNKGQVAIALTLQNVQGIVVSIMRDTTRSASSNVAVEAYAGYKGEETPRAFVCEGRRLQVTEILRRWYTEHHAYFRLRADDDHGYVLRYDWEGQGWELVMQEPPTGDHRSPETEAGVTG